MEESQLGATRMPKKEVNSSLAFDFSKALIIPIIEKERTFNMDKNSNKLIKCKTKLNDSRKNICERMAKTPSKELAK